MVGKNKIDWYFNDGCQGGLRGLTYYFISKTVEIHHGTKEKVNSDNAGDVIVVTVNNHNNIMERLRYIKEKLAQTEVKHIKISNGYKISEPPTWQLRRKFNYEVKSLLSQIEFLNELRSELSILKSQVVIIENKKKCKQKKLGSKAKESIQVSGCTAF